MPLRAQAQPLGEVHQLGVRRARAADLPPPEGAAHLGPPHPVARRARRPVPDHGGARWRPRPGRGARVVRPTNTMPWLRLAGSGTGSGSGSGSGTGSGTGCGCVSGSGACVGSAVSSGAASPAPIGSDTASPSRASPARPGSAASAASSGSATTSASARPSASGALRPAPRTDQPRQGFSAIRCARATRSSLITLSMCLAAEFRGDDLRPRF